jgi:hypothetical protein
MLQRTGRGARAYYRLSSQYRVVPTEQEAPDTLEALPAPEAAQPLAEIADAAVAEADPQTLTAPEAVGAPPETPLRRRARRYARPAAASGNGGVAEPTTDVPPAIEAGITAPDSAIEQVDIAPETPSAKSSAPAESVPDVLPETLPGTDSPEAPDAETVAPDVLARESASPQARESGPEVAAGTDPEAAAAPAPRKRARRKPTSAQKEAAAPPAEPASSRARKSPAAKKGATETPTEPAADEQPASEARENGARRRRRRKKPANGDSGEAGGEA